jgi:hypothetical protein
MPNPLLPCNVTEHSIYSVEVTDDGGGLGLPPFDPLLLEESHQYVLFFHIVNASVFVP